jgi:hypothetical protein
MTSTAVPVLTEGFSRLIGESVAVRVKGARFLPECPAGEPLTPNDMTITVK